jgi:hypothetical protein
VTTVDVAGVPAPEADDGSHTAPDRDRFRRGAMVAIAVAGAIAIAVYVVIALLRIRYPYEIEWIEGGMAQHVDRLRNGQPLYAAPSLKFIPDIYTPLYFVVSWLVSMVTGNGFFPMRLVSVVSSFALFGALYRLVQRETDDPLAGVVGAGLFAATFRIGGAWLDVARVDTLCLALLFWGLVVARDARTTRAGVGAGVLLSLAFLAKQVALFPAIAVFVFLLVRRFGPVALAYAVTVAVGIGGSTLVLDRVYDGWYSFYVFTLPSHHEVVSAEWTKFFTRDLFSSLALALGFGIIAMVGLWRHHRDGFWFQALVFTAILGASYSARLHSGGYDNVLLPIFAAIAVLFAIGVHYAMRARQHWVVAGVALLCLVQFGQLVYNPADQLQHDRNQQAGQAMLDGLRTLNGTVLMTGHPWYLHEVGKPMSAQGAAIEDVLRGNVDGTGQVLASDLYAAVAEQRWDYIVVDTGEGYSYLPDNLCRYYRPDHFIGGTAPALDPLTGTITGPGEVWVKLDVPADHDCDKIGLTTIGPDGK